MPSVCASTPACLAVHASPVRAHPTLCHTRLPACYSPHQHCTGAASPSGPHNQRTNALMMRAPRRLTSIPARARAAHHATCTCAWMDGCPPPPAHTNITRPLTTVCPTIACRSRGFQCKQGKRVACSTVLGCWWWWCVELPRVRSCQAYTDHTAAPSHRTCCVDRAHSM